MTNSNELSTRSLLPASQFAKMRFWPYLAKIGQLAEAQALLSPEECFNTLNSLGRTVIEAMKEVYLVEDNGSHRALLYTIMDRERPFPHDIYEALASLIMISPDEQPSMERSDLARLGVRLAYAVCQWVEAVFAPKALLEDNYVFPTSIPAFSEEEIKDFLDDLLQQVNRYSNRPPQAILDPSSDLASLRSAGQSAHPYKEFDSELRELISRLLFEVRLPNHKLFFNYSLCNSCFPMISEMHLLNHSYTPLKHIELRISSPQNFFAPFTEHIDLLDECTAICISNPKFSYDIEYLASLTESTEVDIIIEVRSEMLLLTKLKGSVTVFAYDQCTGIHVFPELICSFIMPNHPEVLQINAEAAKLLEEWTGDPSLSGYLSHDPNRVLQTAAAIYGTLQKRNIVYAIAPAGFDFTGQRIRLPETVIQEKMGNCLDLTLLYAACLEAAHINTILITTVGHIFVGLWLVDGMFPETVFSDASQLTNRMASGIDQVACVESTFFTAGRNISFDRACRVTAAELATDDSVEHIIDVHRARLTGILPIPMRIKTEDGWRIEREVLENTEITSAPKQILAPLNVNLSDSESPASKKAQWERKLLDLGLRNTLLNLRWGNSIIPILSSSLDALEDCLADGEELQILPRSKDVKLPAEGYGFENAHLISPQYYSILEAEFKNRRLYSTHSDGELRKAVKTLYRSSQSSLEESGANTLFLALGLVRWYENERSNTPRFAPILLLPVELVRKSAAQGFTVRLRDDEPMLNITMLEKFKQDFELTIGGLDPLPLDEHGLDTRLIFSTIRYAIMGQPRWDVLESAYLGIFSFSQFVMWNDLRTRGEDLAQNKIVRSLMDGQLCWEAEDIDTSQRIDPGQTLLPISVDGSQLHAIQEASAGKSFVLHGPPGTGKSQTITALIANALAQGKTVLFVAEKMAALQVVQKRLKAIGIGPFCLEIHSKTSKKSEVLAQLEETTNITKQEAPAEYEFKARQLASLRADLDNYGQALHHQYPCGLSLYDIINIYQDLPEAPEIPWKDPRALEELDRETLALHDHLVRRLILTAREVGHPYDHPLSQLSLSQYSRQDEAELEELLPRWREQLDKLDTALRELVTAMECELPNGEEGCRSLLETGDKLLKWLEVPQEWAKQEHINYYLGEVVKFSQHQLRCAKLRAQILEDWKEEFLKQDAQALLKELEENNSKWILARWSGQKSLLKKIQSWSKTEIDPEKLPEQYRMLQEFHEERDIVEKMHPQYAPGLGRLYRGEDTDWSKVCEEARRVMDMVGQGQDDAQVYQLIARYGGRRELLPLISAVKTAYEELHPLRQRGLALLQCAESSGDWLSSQRELIDNISANIGQLKAWCAWRKTCTEAEQAGLAPLVSAYSQSPLEHDKAAAAYQRAIYRNLAMLAIESSPMLDEFRGLIFNEQIDHLRRLDQEMANLASREIYCRLAANIPNFTREASQNSEVGILQRAIRSKGRGTSLRKLFDRLPNLLHRICPCMLMSPLSVAQYIDPSHTPFDLVVFDEASQMQTCKAIGALARSREAVIVGDPKQMPPTSFFSTASVDEENLDLEDLESILEDCLALRMPQTHLLWHYRSRHESLIAFSNQQFYNNKLYTFPSSAARQSKVSLQSVDGVFERAGKRYNQREAEAIIKELKRRARDPQLSQQSVGIVTFNISQQNLIDDLFNEACSRDSSLERWAYDAEEPLFIKNLENVQGDERDVILFSIGYGPDESGKVSMNFGPLNRDGGWRRLNVAVSRARCEMKIFSSLQPEQIDTNRTRAAGVHALRAFLEYAKTQRLPLDNSNSVVRAPQHQELCRAICQALQQYGFSTDLSVGKSEYKIDIGVVDNIHPQRYLLGIMLDGPSYANSTTTRDREIGQIDVLQGLGWRLTRVWSLDWWENPERELQRLVEMLQNALREEKEAEIKRQQTEEQKAAEEARKLEEERLRAEAEALALAQKAEEILARSTKEFSLEEFLNEEIVPLGTQDPLDGVTISSDNVAKDVSTSNAAAELPVYVAAKLPELYYDSEPVVEGYYDSEVREIVLSALNQEAPISRKQLQVRIVKSLGFKKVGARLAKYLDQVFENLNLPVVTQSDGQEFLWSPGQNPQEYGIFRVNASGESSDKRAIEDICEIELANAVVHVLHEQVSLPEEDLRTELRTLLGFGRITAKVGNQLSNAIIYAAEQQRIRQDALGNWILEQEEKR